MPDSFVVICPTSALMAFASFGSAIGVSNFPSLNNDEDVVSLLSPEGKLIHAINYKNSWFNNAVKSDGGWSLEMIDTQHPCLGQSNWKASMDPNGGTPSKRNSVYGITTDIVPPALLRSFVQDSITIVAVFDETLDSNAAIEPSHYRLDHEHGLPVKVSVLPPLYIAIQLQFSQPLQANIIYQLTVNGITDCSNNMIGQMNFSRVGIGSMADSLDLVVNEILFNPLPNGYDYVEFYNRSEKIIDASHLYIANRSATGTISSPKQICTYPYLVFPGDYMVVTENIAEVQHQYLTRIPNLMIEMNALPSFPDDKGVVILMNELGEKIDELDYDEQWQFPLVSNRQGVALERIDAFAATQLRSNWTSAAFTAGYGTPTYQNSQSKSSIQTNGSINIDPITFSPDNDGYHDICYINYEMKEANYVANIRIYDINGNEIRRLYNNVSLSQKGYLSWDGLGDNNKPLAAGVYIIYCAVFNLQGKTKIYKNAVTLAKRF
jgi:hypothetical protein